MDSESSWIARLASSLGGQLRNGAEYLPGILGALLVVVLGWILARLIRQAVRTVANASNRFLSRNLPTGPLAVVRLSPLMVTLLGEVVFWVVVVIAATVAVRIAGFGMIAQWLDRVAVYLPNLLATLVIVIVGFLLSIFIREQLRPADELTRAPARWAWLAPAAQALVILIALIVGLDQLGIDVGLLIALTVVGVAGVVFTLGATFAMGARQYTANLVGLRSARTQLSVGQWLRIDDIQGQIVELSATQVILDTAQGRVLLPGYYLDTRVATILSNASDEEVQGG